MINITIADITRKPLSSTHEILYAEATTPSGQVVKWDFLEVPVGSEITEGHARFATRHLTRASMAEPPWTTQGGGGPGEEGP